MMIAVKIYPCFTLSFTFIIYKVSQTITGYKPTYIIEHLVVPDNGKKHTLSSPLSPSTCISLILFLYEDSIEMQ